MISLVKFLLYVFPALIGILLVWAGLSYSKTARQKYRLLTYLDGKKHIILIGVVVLLVLEASCGLFVHFSKSDYSSRDRMIANQYKQVLSLFFVKFRMILHCLPLADPIEPEIEAAFHPGVDVLKTGIDRIKTNSNLIALIFRRYDFSKSAVNYLPHEGGRVQSNAEWLIIELKTLHGGCTEILSKYASTGHPELIQKIEIVQGRIENLLNPFGRRDYVRFSIYWLGEFFDQIISSLDLIDRIRNQGHSPGITTTTQDKPAQHTNNMESHNSVLTEALANIRPFSVSDSNMVVTLHKLTHEIYDDLAERQRNNGAFLVGLFKGRIVATGTLTQAGPNRATIKAAVHPDAARLRFGTDMLFELEFQAHHLGYRTIIIDNAALHGVPEITGKQSGSAIIGHLDTVFK